jgi:tetratricopeptide (TPR) repeat protein
MVESSQYQHEAKIYSLYDQGLNARLLGDSHTAVSRLAELTEMLKESHLSPTMQAMAEYEFGRAAEQDEQPNVAIDAYSRSLKLSPRQTDASLRLSKLLLRTGQPALALIRAREAVQRSPNDAQAHLALSLVLERNGFPQDAKTERERSNQLTIGIGKVAEPSEPIENAPEPQGEPVKPDSAPTTSSGAPVPDAPLNDVLNPMIPPNVP